MKTKLTMRRYELGISQWKLCALTKIPRWEIQLFDAGHKVPADEQKKLLARALSTKVEDLFAVAD